MPEAARLTDMHSCPMCTPGTPPVPHVGGPITGPGVATVLIGFLPAATATNLCTCVGPPSNILKGSASVFIGGLPAARKGDPTSHGGTIQFGCPTVIIGDQGGGGGGGADSETEGSGEATAGSGEGEQESSRLEVVLLDYRGEPIPGETVEVRLDDGRTLQGATDAQGRYVLEGVEPGSGRVTFPDIEEENESYV